MGKVRKRYLAGGLDAVFERKHYTYAKLTAGETAERVLALAKEPPPSPGGGTVVLLTKAVIERGIVPSISPASVDRILIKAGVKLGAMGKGPRQSAKPVFLPLAAGDLERLETVLRDWAAPDFVRQRAAVLLHLAKGSETYPEIIAATGCGYWQVFNVRNIYRERGLAGLLNRRRFTRPQAMTKGETAAAILALSREPAPARPGQRKAGWTLTQLADEAVARGIVPVISHGTVERILKTAKMSPGLPGSTRKVRMRRAAVVRIKRKRGPRRRGSKRDGSPSPASSPSQ